MTLNVPLPAVPVRFRLFTHPRSRWRVVPSLLSYPSVDTLIRPFLPRGRTLPLRPGPSPAPRYLQLPTSPYSSTPDSGPLPWLSLCTFLPTRTLPIFPGSPPRLSLFSGPRVQGQQGPVSDRRNVDSQTQVLLLSYVVDTRWIVVKSVEGPVSWVNTVCDRVTRYDGLW